MIKAAIVIIDAQHLNLKLIELDWWLVTASMKRIVGLTCKYSSLESVVRLNVLKKNHN
jgi:hypothetical protein